MKVVHRHLLLLLLTDPSDHTSELDTKSVVDETVSTYEVIAVGAVASHVQHMGAYSRAWVKTDFHKDWNLLLLCLDNGNIITYLV